MRTGLICTQDIAKASNNVLNEFANFNKVFVWNKSSGGANATIINNIGGRNSYLGIGSVSLSFTGNGWVSFNSGGTHIQNIIQRDGNYLLSYAFAKSDSTSDINFIVEMYVNGVLQPNNTITQDLYDSSGFVNGQWNRYFQGVSLLYGDVVDFAFKAQSDTTACYLYFDGLKLELDDRGGGLPTIYTEAPLDVFDEENILTIPEIAAGGTYLVTGACTGAKLNSNMSYVKVSYPAELVTLGLVVGEAVLTADNVVKFPILNPTGAPITPTPTSVYRIKVLR